MLGTPVRIAYLPLAFNLVGEKMRHRLLISALLIGSLAPALRAGYVDHRLIRLRQPDGASFDAIVSGDEFHRRLADDRGHTLVRDGRTGWYDLARYDAARGALVSRGIHYSTKLPQAALEPSAGADLPPARVRELRAEGRERRARGLVHPPAPVAAAQSLAAAPAPSAPNDSYVGAITGLTLLIDFPDESSPWSPATVDSLLNAEGYSRPGVETSLYDFYKEVSGNKLRYRNIVSGYWFRAPLPKANYADFFAMCGLIRQALADLDARGFDFSRLTVGSDGQVRALNVLYAGMDDGSGGNGLWPHTGYLEDGSFSADGVVLSRHVVCWLQHDVPYMGTVAHENGHLLMGWPDLYDNDGSSAGVGPYDLMGFDDWAAPQRPDPSLRLAAGWDEVIDIDPAAVGTRYSIGANQNRIFRLKNPANANESFLVDARPTRSRHWPHDHGGLAIWHVDLGKDVNAEEDRTEESHYRVSLEQSDGRFLLEAGDGTGSRDIFFHAGGNATFHDGTAPNARWWSGDESRLHLRNISGEPTPRGANSVMTFELGPRPTLAKYVLKTAPGPTGRRIALPVPCNLPNGAQGAQPAGAANFGTSVQVGDRLFLDLDGSSYAVPVTSVSPWWLGFGWTTPYPGPGARSGSCSVLRGASGPLPGGAVDPEGPLTVTAGTTRTFRFHPHADHVLSDVRVDGVSVGPVPSYTFRDVAAGHSVAADFVPGTLTYHLTVQGYNGPGTYTGSGDVAGETWVAIGATPRNGFVFDHWIVSFGQARIEDTRANPTRAWLEGTSVILAVYTQPALEDCAGTPAYVDGAAYATGDAVVNGGAKYTCLEGGWCSIGGPYAPGAGWAWQNAWSLTAQCR
jgi:M6 family metalloprotease-like protein